jgi:hypothetical protein
VLADLADVTTLMAELAEALDRARDPPPRRDPGRVLVDLAVAVADGAETISDIAILADQQALFGPVRRTPRGGGCSMTSTSSS